MVVVSGSLAQLRLGAFVSLTYHSAWSAVRGLLKESRAVIVKLASAQILASVRPTPNASVLSAQVLAGSFKFSIGKPFSTCDWYRFIDGIIVFDIEGADH